MENSTDPDQTLRDAESDLGLHCLLRPVEYLVNTVLAFRACLIINMVNFRVVCHIQTRLLHDVILYIGFCTTQVATRKPYLLTCAPNEDSDQPAHPRSLIRVYVVRMNKLCILGYPKCAQ